MLGNNYTTLENYYYSTEDFKIIDKYHNNKICILEYIFYLNCTFQ